jgi:hypothetical protein
VRFRTLSALVALAPLHACDPAADVRIQELPELERSSVEVRLGLAEIRGPWRFAGWELEERDTLGLEAELPSFGMLWLQTQKRDSVAGFYLTGGGGRAPLMGEVRRDGVVALVAFPQPGVGRYLVGSVAEDTLWLETTTLVEPGSWRGDARAAFVRSQSAVTPFRRVRGVFAAAPALDSAALAAADTLSVPPGGMVPAPASAGASRPTATAGPPAATPGRATPPTSTPVPREQTPSVETPPATPPVTEPATVEAEQVEEPEAEVEPEPQPVVERRPPRVLGVPVERDGDRLP